MASAISDLRLAQACVAAAGRLRGVAAERLEPKALVEALVSERPLVGLEALPKAKTLGAVRDPAIITMETPPDVSMRQAAVDDWPKLTKKQSSWADYVYGKQPLFSNRPVVFAAAAGDATASYLDHASTIAGAPFCCLRDADALQAFAAAAGCAEVIEDAPSPESAAAAMGTSCNALNVHATFAQLYAPDLPVRRVLAVAAGPGTPALLGVVADDDGVRCCCCEMSLERVRISPASWMPDCVPARAASSPSNLPVRSASGGSANESISRRE